MMIEIIQVRMVSMRPFNPFYQRLRPANYGKLLRLAIATLLTRCA